jgi:hypothetical protein
VATPSTAECDAGEGGAGARLVAETAAATIPWQTPVAAGFSGGRTRNRSRGAAAKDAHGRRPTDLPAPAPDDDEADHLIKGAPETSAIGATAPPDAGGRTVRTRWVRQRASDWASVRLLTGCRPSRGSRRGGRDADSAGLRGGFEIAL